MKAHSVSTTKTYKRDGVTLRRIESGTEETGTVSYELEIDGLARPSADQWQGIANARAFTAPSPLTRTPTQLQAIVEVIQAALEGQ